MVFFDPGGGIHFTPNGDDEEDDRYAINPSVRQRPLPPIFPPEPREETTPAPDLQIPIIPQPDRYKPIPLSIGDRVLHRKFGAGTVADIWVLEDDQILTVMFDTVGRKKMVWSIVQLKRIDANGNEL
jgi:hypothetical protein